MRAINMQMKVFGSVGREENIFTTVVIKVKETRPLKAF